MFTYSFGELLAQLAKIPTYLEIWLIWLGWCTCLWPMLLVRYQEARVILAWQMGNAIFGTLLALNFGLVRLLGLSHVIFWTPMVFYILPRLRRYEDEHLSRRTWVGIWARAFLLTLLISLVLDYLDVVRYVLGDRALVVE